MSVRDLRYAYIKRATSLKTRWRYRKSETEGEHQCPVCLREVSASVPVCMGPHDPKEVTLEALAQKRILTWTNDVWWDYPHG